APGPAPVRVRRGADPPERSRGPARPTGEPRSPPAAPPATTHRTMGRPNCRAPRFPTRPTTGRSGQPARTSAPDRRTRPTHTAGVGPPERAGRRAARRPPWPGARPTLRELTGP